MFGVTCAARLMVDARGGGRFNAITGVQKLIDQKLTIVEWRGIPLRRPGGIRGIAAVVAFLASPVAPATSPARPGSSMAACSGWDRKRARTSRTTPSRAADGRIDRQPVTLMADTGSQARAAPRPGGDVVEARERADPANAGRRCPYDELWISSNDVEQDPESGGVDEAHAGQIEDADRWGARQSLRQSRGGDDIQLAYDREDFGYAQT